MTPIDGPATLPRCLDDLLATARRGRPVLLAPPPDHIDGDRLFAYWEGNLAPDARRQVEDEAHSCEECRHWLEEIGKLFGGSSLPA